ncbi:LysR family transcriptional regulator [Paenibacillus radicis (ex Xue et al. 2023)]|uniref:LysR family transcriptional regulator n=1 Tax=Paenibacillus radicis (ex Xue et al. 2023) TaxID=2972489 RepID=A0ABT1YVI2_9BACL|nr:LysR family transcriptional regulator [Paenibacillus radicis (ex Xue et al. 2023)]MCR8636951.1 LysR family transcriptional regulator [Paenibacillus radicis (ex Xue et al. 2023)]
MDDRDWTILKVLYEQRNITKTAQLLFISQPALTNRLQQMEKEFGVQIVQRKSRGIEFTPEGEYLAKCADEMLLKTNKIKDHVLNLRNKVSGTLRLGVSNYFTRNKLPGILELFKNQYPDVEFKVVTGWSRDVLNLIYNQHVHIGFVRGDYPWGDRKQLIFEETVCIASRKEINMNDLPNLSRIDYQTDYWFKSLVNDWWIENFTHPPVIGMEVDKVETCREMVIRGLGYAIMPSLVLEGIPNINKINISDKNGNPILRRTWMYYHEEALELNLVKAFVQFMEAVDLSAPL